jgi:NAD(P)-dependent dehydrogenase (short-subunit alcohol dehydrogenase family)
VDLSLQASIRGFAEGILASTPALHVLVNNAGVWLQSRETTREGIERTWATNVLGYFFLTEALLPLLRRSAPARIVNVASRLARGLDSSDVEFRRRPYSGVAAYSQSKQANRLWTWELARRLEGSAVSANAVHPGGVNTEIFAKAGGAASLVATGWARLFGKTPTEGADSVLWLAAASEAAFLNGAFVADRHVEACRFRGHGEKALWDLCASMQGA